MFGRVTRGLDVVQAIGQVATDAKDKPYDDIKIVNVTISYNSE